MRACGFRAAALTIAVLGIPALVWQIVKTWPPNELQLQFFGLQAVGLIVFLVYGLGLAYGSSKGKSRDVGAQTIVESSKIRSDLFDPFKDRKRS